MRHWYALQSLGGVTVQLVTWNCRQGLNPGKLSALVALGADLMVVCEVQPHVEPPAGWSLTLRRADSPRVLGVLARPGWTVRVTPEDPGLAWLLPLDVTGPDGQALVLLAVWTVREAGSKGYEAQVRQALLDWEAACATSGR